MAMQAIEMVEMGFRKNRPVKKWSGPVTIRRLDYCMHRTTFWGQICFECHFDHVSGFYGHETVLVHRLKGN